MKIAMIIQARMTSTRLPGKVLMEVLGKPLLAYQLERLQRCRHLADDPNCIMVATTTNQSDDPIVILCQKLDIPVFRGSEPDVLARYYGAACQIQAEAIVRITADCPLIDPHVVDTVIQRFQEAEGKLDYVSNTLERTFPRGLDTEVFSFQALKEAFEEATAPSHREHVTPFFYTQPQRYRMAQVAAFMPIKGGFSPYNPDFHASEGINSNPTLIGINAMTQPQAMAHHRWTVDTPEDFELIRRILETLYPINPTFDLQDILTLLNDHPDWSALNAHIEQVKV